MEDIYFLENLEPITFENTRESPYFMATLFNASKYFNDEETPLEDLFESQEIKKEHVHSYFGFFRKQGESLENANASPLANYYRAQNNVLRDNLSQSQIIPNQELSSLNGDIYSYHINVGHGNCSIIVADNCVFFIDCSNYDYLIKTSFQKNIDDCIDHIKNKFGINTFKINYFLLTHPHFDHYSGIRKLINQKYIDSNTIFYLNTHYSIPSPTFNKTLDKIKKLHCKIIEPIFANSNNMIKIMYPHTRLIYSKNTKFNFNKISVNNPNNASVVARIIGNDKSFTFTGDIETDAWNHVLYCATYMQNTNYLAISHHGSLNGHLRQVCPYHRNIQNISCCLMKNQVLPIIMGRKNAYPGIPSNQVISDFQNNVHNVIFSEHDLNGKGSKFVEIQWGTGKPIWF